MKRREAVVELGDGPPPEMVRFRYADWSDESVPVPVDRRGWKSPTWHHLQARRRYLDARRAWCAERGRSYAETFHPEWSRWGRGQEIA